jgi:lipopolysaccharide export LptBFGC system permease protein LptF
VLIDRYIIGRFLLNFAILFSLLFVFAMSVDLILQLDEFVEAAKLELREQSREAGFGAVLLSVLKLVIGFHGPRVFQFYGYLVGLVSIGALGFTLAQMIRHRELVALLATGTSMHRIAMPFIVAAFGLNLLQIANAELILPKLAPQLMRKHGEIRASSAGPFAVGFTRDGHNSLIQSPRFDPRTGVLEAPLILQRDEAGRTTRRITAREARWDPAAGGWRLIEGVAETVAAPDDAAAHEQRQGGGDDSTILSAESRRESIDLVPSDVTPQILTLRQYAQYASMLSLRQINEMMKSPDVVDTSLLERYRYSRLATLCINMLMLVISLPFFLLREPANLLQQSVMCAATSVPAMVGAVIMLTLRLPGIPPALSVFLPPITLIPVALWRMMYLKT